MHKLKILVLIIFITSFELVRSQNKELIVSINSSLIDIGNSNPEYSFKDLSKLQDIFQNVKIFGFGEATHGTKEFQDLKDKFFRYLVLNRNVKTFAIEASYSDCLAINSYIKDGGEGNPKDLLSKIGYWIWNTNEILSLIEWMKLYNSTQSKENQLNFIGIDVLNCENASNILFKYLQSNSSPDSQKYLTILNNYISKNNLKNFRKKEFEEHYLVLKSLELELKHLKDPYLSQLNNSILQYISMKINYTQSHRDELMFENVNWLVENSNSNIFICAHNSHIKKNNISFTSLGYHLKNKYSEKYYSVGFDFGSGSFNAWDIENNKIKKYSIDEPLKKTSTEVFNNASSDVYILDFNKSSFYPILNDFIMSKVLYRDIGSTYSPKMVQKEKLNKAFDGIIFVKKSSESSLLH
jgi:erythromycin esterase